MKNSIDFIGNRTQNLSACSAVPKPGRKDPQERPGTHCTGGWVGARAGLDRCGKSGPPPGFDPRTAQPVASRYTDYATRPTLYYLLSKYSNF